MANEFRISYTASKTVVVKVYKVADSELMGSFTVPEVATGYYVGSFPAYSAGTYDCIYSDGSTVIGNGSIVWNGTKEILDADVIAKLNRIGSGRVTVVAPLADSSHIEIVSGDDYLDVDGRAIAFTFSGSPDLTGATVLLKAVPRCCNECQSFNLTRIEDSADLASFELTAEQTSALCQGDYAYDFAVVATLTDASIVTLAEGSIEVYVAIADDDE